jgi:capsule polysaccharide export protein KpsE/RkpR
MSMMGTVAALQPRRRRAVIIVLILICLLLALFPERYRSAVTLAPSDPASLGLGGALSQLGAASTVFGNAAATEITVRVAGSSYVREYAIKKLNLMGKMNFGSETAAHRWLTDAIEIRSVRGGMVQIETQQRDAQFAEALITAYTEAIRQRLAYVNRQQTGYKRKILEQLVAEAGDRLDQAQAEYDAFRLQSRYSDPRAAIEAIGDRIPALQAAIKAKEVQLNAARKFATEDNMSVLQIISEIEALKRQLAQQRALSPFEENSVGRVVSESTKSRKLERKLQLAQTLYDGYNRYLQGTAVEDMTANANLRVIEPPFIDTDRQYNFKYIILAAILALLGLAIEFYNLRPPLESRAI